MDEFMQPIRAGKANIFQIPPAYIANLGNCLGLYHKQTPYAEGYNSDLKNEI